MEKLTSGDGIYYSGHQSNWFVCCDLFKSSFKTAIGWLFHFIRSISLTWRSFFIHSEDSYHTVVETPRGGWGGGGGYSHMKGLGMLVVPRRGQSFEFWYSCLGCWTSDSPRVETSVTLNSLPEDYSHLEGHNNQAVSTWGLNNLPQKCAVPCNPKELSFPLFLAKAVSSFFRSILAEKVPICSPGWQPVGDQCFLLYLGTYKTWIDAEVVCNSPDNLRASLAKVTDKSSLEGLQNLVAECRQSTTPIFVGARGRLNWLWLDNSNVTSNRWGPGEPSGDGQCGSISHGSHWKDWALNDIPCSTRLGYICQIPAGK